MFYIHQSSCISPQQTFGDIDLEKVNLSVNGQLAAIEPAYAGISPGIIRRMGKAARLGVGAGLPLLQQNKVDGIIIGTANGGIEDSIKFLNQIIDYQEGTLTPTNFVQSTNNAIAGQLGMITKNTGYNATHVHRGFAFENALLDADMLIRENPAKTYMVGGVEEISPRNYNMETLTGSFRKEPVVSTELYNTNAPGTLTGEGAAMFIVSGESKGAVAKLKAFRMLNIDNSDLVSEELKRFLKENLGEANSIDLLFTGENGDNRLSKYYNAAEQLFDKQTTVARFKHLTGEFPCASAIGLWMACQIIQTQSLPLHFVKRKGEASSFNHVLIYNNYKGLQHSFILLERV